MPACDMVGDSAGMPSSLCGGRPPEANPRLGTMLPPLLPLLPALPDSSCIWPAHAVPSLCVSRLVSSTRPWLKACLAEAARASSAAARRVIPIRCLPALCEYVLCSKRMHTVYQVSQTGMRIVYDEVNAA